MGLQRGAPAPGAGRRDARYNRELILRAAGEAFAQGSEVVPLAEIARRTGLGRATVYRHFPDRHALGDAVARQKLRALRDLLGGACFLEVLHRLLTEQIAHRPLVRLFRELPVRAQRRYATELVGVLTPALRRAQESGRVRPDVEPADLVVLFDMVESALLSRVSADPAAATRQLVDVLVDGMRGRSTADGDQSGSERGRNRSR